MDPFLTRALIVVAIVAASLVVGRLWRWRDGRVEQDPDDPGFGRDHLDAVGLQLDDARAGAVLLGAEWCQPCDTVRQVLGELEGEVDGFRWVYADAAEHLELAQQHRVLRVPTLFVIEPGGRILARTTGVPRTQDLRQVLDGEHASGPAA